MADYIGEDLTGSRFEHANLSGTLFNRSDFTDAEIRSCELNGTRFRNVEMNGVLMRGMALAHVDIRGEIGTLIVNGVDVGDFVNAELDRRYPDRVKMRPTDAAGFREAWDVVERLWAGTVDRARQLRPDQLHESVGGEWSFIQTLRHLVFATDSWVRRALLGDPSPYDPLDLPWDEADHITGIPRDREARPSLDVVLQLRYDRMATVREFVDGLTDEALDGETKPVDAPGWPPPESFPVRECLLVVLNEEWEHRLYAERDLNVLADGPDQ